MNSEGVYEAIDRVRDRPAMYLGECTLARMEAFLFGCYYATQTAGITWQEEPPFHGFHQWAVGRLDRMGSIPDWYHLILESCDGDEPRALGRFFELVEEYRSSGGSTE